LHLLRALRQLAVREVQVVADPVPTSVAFDNNNPDTRGRGQVGWDSFKRLHLPGQCSHAHVRRYL